MSAIAALLPPAVPAASPAANVMAFQMERRMSATSTLAAVRAAAAADPRQALRQAHADRGEAAAEVARLTDLLGRAREHLSSIAERRSVAEARARPAAGDAATGLIRALEAGASAAIAIDDGAAAKAARLTRETEIAGAAVDRLAAELVTAQERQRVATWRVRALALARLEAHGVQLAEAMLAEQQMMRRRRAHLAALQALLSSEGRAVFGDAITPPAAISAAVTPADPPPSRLAPATNPWSGQLAALIEDAEVEVSG